MRRLYRTALDGLLRFAPPLLLGVVGGALTVIVSGVNPKLVLLLAAVVPLVAVAVIRPRYGILLAILAICLIDEFPGGIGDSNAGGDEFKRSERTPFYSRSLGLPAFYAPDLMLGGLLLLCIVKAVLRREHYPLRLDKIGVAMGLIGLATLLSIVIPLAGARPFGAAVLDLSTLGSLQFKDAVVHDVARYVAILHYKLFLTLFPSYFLGLYDGLQHEVLGRPSAR